LQQRQLDDRLVACLFILNRIIDDNLRNIDTESLGHWSSPLAADLAVGDGAAAEISVWDLWQGDLVLAIGVRVGL